MEFTNNLFTKRNIIIAIVIAILVISIPIGVYLVQQQTQLKSKAAGSANVKFVGGNVSGTGCQTTSGDCIVTSQEVSVSLTDPFIPSNGSVRVAPPTVTTNDPSSITTTNVRLDGVAVGGVAITEYGFLFKASTTTPTCTTSNGGGCFNITWTGSPPGTSGNFAYILSDLTAGTVYWVRAYAKNGTGESINTDWKRFTTLTR